MRLKGQISWVAGGVLACGACSLHSLDYLGDSDAVGLGGSSGGGNGGSGSSGASGSSTSGGGAASGTSGGGSGATPPEAGSDGIGDGGEPPEVPDCNDDERTADETDVDCGGRTCSPCDDGQRCFTGTDCASAICTNQVCQPPTCVDLAVNGSETDLNCGGSCPKCAEGQHCLVDGDCATGKCGQNVCYSPSCSDDVLQDGCSLLVDNTPYSLAPEHAPSKCIDDNRRSVADGNAMVLFTCIDEPHQTFWTVARAEGYFAFRNALSGKCLHLRGASTNDGAAVEQRSCDYSSAQLWKPERVDAEHMRLRSKLSELVLDVAGQNVSADGQAIVQSEQADSSDMHWRLQKRSEGAHIALRPNDDAARHITHDGALTIASSDDDDESSHWRVVPGLGDPSGVSFQSRDEPGRYLRHAAFRIWSDKNDGSDIFKKDATFRFVNPFVGTSSQTHGIESINYGGWFMLRDGDTIRLVQFADTPEYRNAATWWLSPR